MKKDRRIINIAFSIYPDYKSSEGIVNFNWQNILIKNNKNIVEISQKKSVDFSIEQKTAFSKENYIYFLLKSKLSLGGIVYKIFNKIFSFFYCSSLSLYQYLWSKKSYKELVKKKDSESVVWSRILPVISLKPILKFYKKEKFPFVVNVNDPIVAKSLLEKEPNKYTADQKMFLASKNKAQAWTFPSNQLANMIAKTYDLDRERCFVIPHAYTPFKDYYKRDKGSVIKLLYTGTFYKSAFTNEFKETLEKIKKTSLFKKLEFTFILSQYDKASIIWLQEALPNVILKFKLDRSEVFSILKKSDVMLVVDAETHTELLKGKLVEAISYGIPVFAATYKGSVMDSIVLEYGCFPAYQNIQNDLYLKLIKTIESLDNNEWLSKFYNGRENIISKFSEKSILNATYSVTEFAFQRFIGNKEFKIKEPLNWP